MIHVRYKRIGNAELQILAVSIEEAANAGKF